MFDERNAMVAGFYASTKTAGVGNHLLMIFLFHILKVVT